MTEAENKEIAALRVRMDIMERLVSMLSQRAGIETAELEQQELRAIVDHCASTGDYRPLQEYQRSRNQRRRAAA